MERFDYIIKAFNDSNSNNFGFTWFIASFLDPIFRLKRLEITGIDKLKRIYYKTTESSLPNSVQSDINVNADDDNSQTLSNEKNRLLATLRNDSDDSLLKSTREESSSS
ncbi:hypothetical protein BpHYR1_006551 [Brachionus plicatilis]|uniref:Uncharacterized protein n=1 Tax=Brachionus plicatilis TaxID=10195 RepID=A0A3M7SZ92_BRAPC|nr:hypothetical protein BpHYR1_006551 [Brachionus plicatilis]